ncbi:MAG: glycosyltransferase [Candidatus Altiarchaeia archaeon]
MRIAQVTKYFYPHMGGIESNALGISEGLADLGHAVLVLTSNIPGGEQAEELSGICVLRSRSYFTAFNDPFTPGIFANLMREDYDIIHVHLPDPFNSVYALLAAKIRKKPLFVTYHADIIKNRWYHLPFKIAYSFFSHQILKNATKIIATTPDYVKESQIPKKFRDRVVIVPNFVDSGKYIPELSGYRIRKEHSLDNKKVILFLGRLVPYKGVEYLIAAYKKIKENVKDATLVIAGEGPLEEELKKQASDLKLEGVVFTTVVEDDIPEYYAACDLFVLPSVTRQEAFGIVLLEAMSSGKPVVSTNISGMPYVVGDAGLVVPPKDPEALANAVIRILTEKDLRVKMGRRARERVEKEFNKEYAAEKTLKIYLSEEKL